MRQFFTDGVSGLISRLRPVDKSSSSLTDPLHVICKCSLEDEISLQSSHNFLHNIIVTFSHCVPGERWQQTFSPAQRVIATSPSIPARDVKHSTPPTPLRLSHSSPSHQIHVPAMFQLIIFYASEKFYKFYRHHHENCRRILTWNFNLSQIKAGRGPYDSICKKFEVMGALK